MIKLGNLTIFRSKFGSSFKRLPQRKRTLGAKRKRSLIIQLALTLCSTTMIKAADSKVEGTSSRVAADTAVVTTAEEEAAAEVSAAPRARCMM